ncbi:MAG: FAD-dependent oxidoreductase, partial [Planctomycetaceae bacterium]|nr:FAD-dependent oxidoreductase [Planctomycetaceae bacterium]
MGVNLSALGGGVSDDIIAFYEARARGGVGLIISELTRVVDGAGAGEPCQLAARSFKDVPDLQRLVNAIHKYDTKLFLQLQHPGLMGSIAVTGEKLVAPSVFPGMEEVVRELSTDECDELVQAFVTGAQVAQMAGADGVELHAAHGYLINQFLSPAFNHRSDKYGVGFEGRMRFAVDILHGIKNKCGRHFPVSVRINAHENIPGLTGGIDLDEAKKIAAELERAGADAINVSCLSIGCIEPGTYAQGWKKDMVAAIKSAVKIPVIAVCHIKEPETGERLLTEGVCDFIGVGRGHLADPQWCNKAFERREGEIRRCIGCIACFDEICKLHRVKCAVNPVTGREREFASPNRNGNGKTVAIVGGGPAGIQAALVLKDRHFVPVIFEEKTRLGGSLDIADKGFGKTFITKYVDSLITQVEREGIEIRYGEKATVERIRELNPCGIFVACGASAFKPPVEGIDSDHVCTAEDVLMGKVKPTGAVAVIGSGMTGL